MELKRMAVYGRRLAIVAALLILLASGGLLLQLLDVLFVAKPTPPALQAPACSEPVSIQPPAADFAATVSQHPPGTCFLLEAGTYRFHDVVPRDGMTFTGVASDTVIVDGNGYENAFHGTADRVTITRMTLRNFNDSGGTSRQEQAPIRGTSALWASNRGQMATNWLISDIVSHGNYASGVFLGEHWTVRNSVFHSNGVTGIGGNHLVGGLIEGNIVYNNGANQAGGALVNGGGLKITQAGTPTHPVIVRNNEFYNNETIGIWCDIGCDGFHVIDNYIHDHVSYGVMYELSSNAVVRGNTILRSNTWANFLRDWNAGAIGMGESRGAVIENNLIDGAQSGVTIRQTRRPYSSETFLYNYPYVNWVASDVVVRDNIVRNTRNMGISTGTTGHGQITQPETIRFVGNSYDNPGGMTFWWNDGQQMDFASWQSAGRDTTANGSQPSSPENQSRGPGQGTETTTTTAAPAQTTTTTTAPAQTTTTSTPASAPSTTAPSTSDPVPSTTAPVVEPAPSTTAPSTSDPVPSTTAPVVDPAPSTTAPVVEPAPDPEPEPVPAPAPSTTAPAAEPVPSTTVAEEESSTSTSGIDEEAGESADPEPFATLLIDEFGFARSGSPQRAGPAPSPSDVSTDPVPDEPSALLPEAVDSRWGEQPSDPVDRGVATVPPAVDEPATEEPGRATGSADQLAFVRRPDEPSDSTTPRPVAALIVGAGLAGVGFTTRLILRRSARA